MDDRRILQTAFDDVTVCILYDRQFKKATWRVLEFTPRIPSGRRTKLVYMSDFSLCLMTVSVLKSLNFLRMSARVDAVASRVQSAVTMKQVISSTCSHTLDIVMLFWCAGDGVYGRGCQSNGLGFVFYEPRKGLFVCVVFASCCLWSRDSDQVTTIMEKFERQFEDLDVQSQSMEDAMSSTTTLTVPTVWATNTPICIDALISISHSLFPSGTSR